MFAFKIIQQKRAESSNAWHHYLKTIYKNLKVSTLNTSLKRYITDITNNLTLKIVLRDHFRYSLLTNINNTRINHTPILIKIKHV